MANIKKGDYKNIVTSLGEQIKKANGNNLIIEKIHQNYNKALSHSIKLETGVSFEESTSISFENQNKVALKYMDTMGNKSNIMKKIKDNMPVSIKYDRIDSGKTWGQCWSGSNVIDLNTSVYKNIERMTSEARENMKQGWWVKGFDGEEFAATAVHETGHALHNALALEECNNDKWAYFDRRERLITAYKQEICKYALKRDPNMNLPKLNRKMSKYGKTNSREFFAEAFANAMGGKPDIIGLGMIDFLKARGLL